MRINTILFLGWLWWKSHYEGVALILVLAQDQIINFSWCCWLSGLKDLTWSHSTNRSPHDCRQWPSVCSTCSTGQVLVSNTNFKSSRNVFICLFLPLIFPHSIFPACLLQAKVCRLSTRVCVRDLLLQLQASHLFRGIRWVTFVRAHVAHRLHALLTFLILIRSVHTRHQRAQLSIVTYGRFTVTKVLLYDHRRR